MPHAVGDQRSRAIKGGGTEFPMFIANLFLQRAKRMRQSTAVLLGKIRKAFYSVLAEYDTGKMLPDDVKFAL